MKLCPNCQLEKSHTEFNKNKSRKDGYAVYCKHCTSIRYQERYKEKHIKRSKKYQEENREKILAKKREYTENHREEKANYDKIYRKQNAKKIAKYKREWEKDQLANNPEYRIKANLRRRLNHALDGNLKVDKTMNLLGCDIQSFKDHLESQFTSNMTWDNYGSVWHIDHIKPCASYNFLEESEQRDCFHYTNMQPLLVIDNQKKGSKWSD